MRKLLIVLMLLVAGIRPAIAQTTPIEFNDKMVAMVAELYDIGQQWGNAVNVAAQNDDWSGLKPIREQMQSKVNEDIAMLQATKDVKNSNAFRTAVIGFLKYELKLINECFKPFESFDANTSAETMVAAKDRLTAASTDEEKALTKLREEQSKYAASNGFEIEKE
jgi:hypothetical protein